MGIKTLPSVQNPIVRKIRVGEGEKDILSLQHALLTAASYHATFSGFYFRLPPGIRAMVPAKWPLGLGCYGVCALAGYGMLV